MTLDSVALYFLSILSLLASNQVTTSPDWTIISEWKKYPSGYEIIARSTTIPLDCEHSPSSYVKFPMIVDGAHEIFLDDRKILAVGKRDFSRHYFTYAAAVVSCEDVKKGQILEWHGYAYTKFFAKILEMPSISKNVPLDNLFYQSVNLIAAGITFFITFFAFAIFFRKVSHFLTLSITFSCLFFSGYFISTVPGLLEVPGPSLFVHKWGNLFLWLGFLFYLNALRLNKYFTWKLYGPYSINVIFGLIWILFSKTGDGVQFGIDIPFLFGLVVLVICLKKKLKELIQNHYLKQDLLEFVSFLFFTVTCFNDVFVITRLANGYMFLSIGIVGGIIFFVLGINEKINQTYKERDYLRENLEIEVKKKTAELENAQLKLVESAQKDLQHAKELSKIALNVAHDIRSPIAALSILGPTLKASSSAETLILRTAIDRIHHIADTLLTRYRGSQSNDKNRENLNQKSIELLTHAIEPILIEKRYQNKNNPKIKLDLKLTQDSYGVFASIQPKEFQRILSNLLNNAIEALPGEGTVTVQIKKSQFAEILIQDNGKGIPSDQLSQLGKEGVTFGKIGGSGLGLSHAKKLLEEWGGRLEIFSEVGKGSSVVLKLPPVNPPEWFLSALNFYPNMKLCIVDDDPSIFQAWQVRLNEDHLKNSNIQLFYLSSLSLLSQFIQSHVNEIDLYLVDYEFEQERHLNGIETLIKLNLQSKSILVSNHSSNKSIQDLCLQHQIKILPKDFLSIVPINLGSKEFG